MRTPPSAVHRPKKSLGQNFLVDRKYIDRIIAAVAPAAGEIIFEIGPGRGAITEKLVEFGAHVVAIELDSNLIETLREKFHDSNSFQVVEQDALTVDFGGLLEQGIKTNDKPAEAANSQAIDTDTGSSISNLKSEISNLKSHRPPAKLVANLPYYISTAILQHLAARRAVFSSLVLMFQREVVERITAKPRNSERGYLTVLAEAAFEIERLFDVPPQAFRPVPKVWGSVVRLRPNPPGPADDEDFRKLVSTAFAQKRKTIANNLKAAYANYAAALETAGIDSRSRAETFSLEQWLALNDAVRSIG